MREGGFEDGITKDPKAKNTEIFLSPPRDGGENEEKNIFIFGRSIGTG